MAPPRWHAWGVFRIVLPTWWHVRAKAKEFVKLLIERCLALTTTPPNYHVRDQTNWVVHVLACSQNKTPFWTKGIKTNATCSIKHKFCRCSPKLLWGLRRIGKMMATCSFSKSHPSSFQSRMVRPLVVLVVGGSSHGNMSSGLIHDVSP